MSAKLPWVDTGVDLNAGEALTISANGQWTNGGNPPALTGPNGFGWTLPVATLSSASFAALIAKVGDQVFLVGSAYNKTSPGTGRLYLQINDDPNALADNDGTLNVEVRHPAGTPFQDQLKDGSTGPAMVKVPSGTFNMGASASESAGTGWASWAMPTHSVTIAKPFAIGAYEVTFQEYDAFAKATGRTPPSDQGYGREKRPVINVSWDDAWAYAVWLSAQTGARYRLPSEAEWEYACRAGSTTNYSFGDDAASLGEFAWYLNNAVSKTQPVGQKRPNAFGLYDMHGNVWEWVEDFWHDNYNGAPTDGRVWDSGAFVSRVLRGGNWANDASRARSASRYPYNGLQWNVGFRLAQDL